MSTKEHEIVYIRILNEGKPINVFLGLMVVNSGTAEGIFQGLQTFFTELGIDNSMSKLVGLGTDGACVNCSSRGGVGAIINKDIPHLIHIHCIAHKLELAVLEACKQVAYIEKFQTTIKSLLK